MGVDRTEEDWVAHFEEIHGTEIRIYIEKGKRIREFHDAYHRERWKFANRWDDACRRVIRLAKGTCSYYETIYRVLGRMDEERLMGIIPHLPADVYALNFICRSLEINEEFVTAMIEQKTIQPEMQRDDVNALFSLAQQIQKAEHDKAKGLPEEKEENSWPQPESTENLLPQENLGEALNRIKENHEILPEGMAEFVPIIWTCTKWSATGATNLSF